YELNPAGSLALEFTLPVQIADMSSNKLMLDMEGKYAGNPRSPRPAVAGQSLGQIFLYNWQTADWDAQDFAWGQNPIDDPTPYLSARTRFACATRTRLRRSSLPPASS